VQLVARHPSPARHWWPVVPWPDSLQPHLPASICSPLHVSWKGSGRTDWTLRHLLSPVSFSAPSQARWPSCATWTTATTTMCARALPRVARGADLLLRRRCWRPRSVSFAIWCSCAAPCPFPGRGHGRGPCPCSLGWSSPFCCGGGGCLMSSSFIWTGCVQVLGRTAGLVVLGAGAGRLHAARLRPASIGRVQWACRAARLSAKRAGNHLGRWAQKCKESVNCCWYSTLRCGRWAAALLVVRKLVGAD
jgi:hypothetical protein